MSSRIIARRADLGDSTTIDLSTVPPVDIVCGGFPCEDVSTVGRMVGLARRSGFWAHMATGIHVLQSEWVVIEYVLDTKRVLDMPAGAGTPAW